MSHIPLFHVFTRNEHFYIYDSNTNKILKVPEDIGKKLREIEKSGNFDNSKLLQRFQKDGFLEPGQVKKLETKFSDEEKKRYLKNNVGSISLKITEKCNLGCDYCIYSDSYPSKPSFSENDMPSSVIRKSIDIFSQRSTKSDERYLVFYGGEALVNMEGIREAVEYSENVFGDDIQYNLATNGVKMKDEILDFLYEKDFEIQVSLDGPKDIHNKHRKYKDGSPTFEDIKKNLLTLKELDKDFYEEKVRFNATLTPPYEILRVDEFFSENELVKNNSMNADFVNFALENNWQTKKGQKYEEKLSQLKEKYIHAILDEQPERSALGHNFFEMNLSLIHRRKMKGLGSTCYPNGVCIPGLKTIYILPTGDISFCEKIEGELKLGNVERGLSEDRAIKILDEYSKRKEDVCSDCWAIRLCKNCYADDLYKGEYNDRITKKSCKERKSNLGDSLEIYTEIRMRNDEALDFLGKN